MAKYSCPTCNKPCEDPLGCFLHKPKKPLAKTGGFKTSTKLKRKKKSQEEIEQNKAETAKMWALFEEVFRERGPYSEIDGTYLGSELKSWMVDHLIEKSIHPELKYEKENLFLVTFDQHQRKSQGFPDPIHAEAIQKAKQRFGIL
jgi:hypothetical protein